MRGLKHLASALVGAIALTACHGGGGGGGAKSTPTPANVHQNYDWSNPNATEEGHTHALPLRAQPHPAMPVHGVGTATQQTQRK